MNIQHIETLMYNPFFLSKIIQCFLTGYKKESTLKIVFYVLPIVMFKDSRDRLNQARSDSTLRSIFMKEVKFEDYSANLNSKFSLSQVTELFDDYIEPTKLSIIILQNQKKIQLGAKVILLEKLAYQNMPPSIREYFKSAHYLGQILSNIEVTEFENFLEIKMET
ncbi:three component ABC system middle component [Paenibacillus ehimensis]|uniref:three component ABC system middle component n=1 Tax=Paenibacillus ehimensis TaxID=79264 RepID=UPI0004700385|nr:three component ABC system middle component [Paenibacillus ehimensis]